MKKLVSAILSTAILLSSLTLTVSAEEGTAISTAAELLSMTASGSYYLTKDIDLSGSEWHGVKSFSGKLDGKGHTVSNLSSDCSGLFYSLSSNAEIRNLTLDDMRVITEGRQVGGIANSVVKGAENVIIADCYVGGYIGTAYSKKLTENRGKLTADFSKCYAGGIVGIVNSANATIEGCYSNAAVLGEKTVGGIVGYNLGTVSECDFHGTIEHSQNTLDSRFRYSANDEFDAAYSLLENVGGICGVSSGRIERCVVVPQNGLNGSGCVGGIVGKGFGSLTISECVSEAKIGLGFDADFSGGIAGRLPKNASCKSLYYFNAENAFGKDMSNAAKAVFLDDSSTALTDCPELDFEKVWALTKNNFELWRLNAETPKLWVLINGKLRYYGKKSINMRKVGEKLEKLVPTELYGGICYDGAITIVMATDRSKVLKIVEETYPELAGIEVYRCDNSLAKLNEIKEAFEKNMPGCCSSVRVDVRKNRVIVKASDLTTELVNYVHELNAFEQIYIELLGELYLADADFKSEGDMTAATYADIVAESESVVIAKCDGLREREKQHKYYSFTTLRTVSGEKLPKVFDLVVSLGNSAVENGNKYSSTDIIYEEGKTYLLPLKKSTGTYKSEGCYFAPVDVIISLGNDGEVLSAWVQGAYVDASEISY